MVINQVKKQCIEILKQNPKKLFTAIELDNYTGLGIKRIKYNLNQIVKMNIGIEEAHQTIGNYHYSLGYYYDEDLNNNSAG